MANVQNSFIKSKLNKDLDARLIPNGEYRDARNVQVSRSEGSNVGSLENVLGNKNILNFETITSEDDMVCIGKVVNDSANELYLFLTSYTDPNPGQLTYSRSAENYIVLVTINSTGTDHKILATGSFLNFSTTHEIFHANLLEGLLFWTDNRNQPRKINVDFARANGVTYYTNEDQISVAKYNPFQPIQLWQENTTSSADVPYETTMKDVTSKIFPNGAIADAAIGTGGTNTLVVTNLTGEVPLGAPYGFASVSYLLPNGNILPIGTVATVTYNDPSWTVVLSSGTFPVFSADAEIIFNANTYYDKNFAGDPNYLEDKFVRFSYRFKFEDNEYSLMAPFTQVAFIPKQDGYFMYVRDDARNFTSKDDQAAAYRSTVVSFVENKVDAIKLLIPLPYSKSTIVSSLKIKELDILYKESDALAIKVIETIEATELTSGADSSVFEYDYLSKKPYKVLPSSDTTRVYDKIPVRAFAQEIASNRIVYGNFQTKHTPPTTLDYNVAVGDKSFFNLETGTASVNGAQNIAANVNFNVNSWVPFQLGNNITTGMIVSITSSGAILGNVSAVTSNTVIKIDAAVNLANGIGLTFNPAGADIQTVSRVEYPNHSLKQNRNYQVGVVLSDRYGRTSTVVLSRSNTLIGLGNSNFIGDTIYSPYLTENIKQEEWPGNSLKMLFNSTIGPNGKNVSTGEPGIYNGISTSDDYNPLGWYSYKIVVKQTEQEYYNVYLPGIMAAYPEDFNLELGKTSHAVLINDNINKVPRDLTEVGPDQKQFRSSVQLFGRVENTAEAATYNAAAANVQVLTNAGSLTDQYYPGRNSDTVSTISTLRDLFDYDATDLPIPNYFPQFYLNESNPLIARISTENKIGQIASTNYNLSSATVVSTSTVTAGTTNIVYKDLVGTPIPTDLVSGIGIPENTTIDDFNSATNTIRVFGEITIPADTRIDMVPAFPANFIGEPKPPGIQYLAVYETEPVESLLDIFWETTSTGIVSELNTLILNATGGGAGLSGGLNTSNWTEALVLNNNVFNTSFTLVDSFGVNIPSTAAAPAISISSVTLNSVTNGFGTNVQTSDSAGPYFELVTISAGFFNIKLLQPYIDNVFYGQSSEARNFTFSITGATTDGTTITEFTELINAGPSNVRPAEAVPPIVTTPVGLSNSTVYSNRYTSLVASATATNGSSSNLLKATDINWSLISVFDQTLPSTDIGPSGSDLGYFTMINSTETGPLRKGTLNNTSGGNMPPSIFNITIGVADAGGPEPIGTNISFVLDLNITPLSVGIGDVTYCLTGDSIANCPSGELDSSKYVVIQINDGTTDQNGFYIYDIGQITFAQWASGCFGGQTISIDYTNRQTSNSGQPINSCDPAYGTTLSAAKIVLEERNYEGSASYGNAITPSGLSAYTFEII